MTYQLFDNQIDFKQFITPDSKQTTEIPTLLLVFSITRNLQVNMDQPGLSLFQGGESIHVEGLGNAAAEEEDEDLIDRKRREDELGRQLQNAFDDLLDDDDETLDDSYQSGPSFRNHCGDGKREEQQIGGQKRHHISNEDEDDQEANSRENALYRLRMELQSKNNELDHVSMVSKCEKINHF